MWRRDRAVPAARRVRRKVGKARLRVSSRLRNWLLPKKTHMWERWCRRKFDWGSTRAHTADFRRDRNFPARVLRPKSYNNRARIWKQLVAELTRSTHLRPPLPPRGRGNSKSV